MQSGVSFMQSGLVLLNELGDSDIDWLLAEGTEERFAAGAAMVAQGSRPDSLFVVLSGLFKVFLGSPDGKELATLGPGQIVGEMSFLEDRPASAYVVAVEPSRALALPRKTLDAKLARDPLFSARLYRALAVAGSRRSRDMMGILTRWMEDQPPSPANLSAESLEVAERTQEMKSLLRNAQKKPEAQDAAALGARLRDFSRYLNQAIGDSSAQSIDYKEDLGARVQRELLPYLLQSTLASRVYSKPRGYSEDYETLAHVYANHPSGKGDLGELLDLCLLSLPVVEALRARKRMLAEAIVRKVQEGRGSARVAGLGCGPGEEVFDATQRLDSTARLQASLADFDPQALEHFAAFRRSLPRSMSFRLCDEHLVGLAAGRFSPELCELDLIFSGSLMGHLSPRSILSLLNKSHACLRPGGEVAFAFLSAANPDKAFMDHVLDWRVGHHGEQEIGSLFLDSAFRQAPVFTTDPDRIVLIASARRNE